MQEEEVDAISNWEKKGLHFYSLVCVSEIKTPSVLFVVAGDNKTRMGGVHLYCVLTSHIMSYSHLSRVTDFFVLFTISEVCAKKRKSQSFRDEDYYISSVPQNQVFRVNAA
jgi:hypothetical protein